MSGELGMDTCDQVAPCGAPLTSRYSRHVTSAVPIRHMTAQELLRYRHEPHVQELIAGKLYEMEPPGADHGIIAARVGALLFAHVQARQLGIVFGETGFLLASDPDTVRAPDAAFVAQERAAAIGRPKGTGPGRRTLRWRSSPSMTVAPRLRPRRCSGSFGDACGGRPRTATVYRTGGDIRVLEGDDPLDLDDVVTGWAPPVAELFA